jgi:hypothetical protein
MLGLLQFLYVLLINAVIGRFVYTQIVQNHLAPSGYIKIPTVSSNLQPLKLLVILFDQFFCVPWHQD